MPEAELCSCGAIVPEPPCARCRRSRRDPYQSPEWKQLVKRVISGRRCTVCKSTDRRTLHHVNGRQADITVGPFIVLCGSCHSSYEMDVRQRRMTPHRRAVDRLGRNHPIRTRSRATQ